MKILNREWTRRNTNGREVGVSMDRGSRVKRRFALRRYDTLVVLFGGNSF
jgi:hypothetical protein